jgi:hypothetical protein
MVTGRHKSLTIPEFASPASRQAFSLMLGLILDSLIGWCDLWQS